MTQHYELLYLVAATMTEEEVHKVREQVKRMLAKYESKITLEESQGKKRLAYPVDKNHQGYYELLEFDLEGAKLVELERELRLSNELLRHIVVKKTPKTAGKGLLKVTRVTAKPDLDLANQTPMTPKIASKPQLTAVEKKDDGSKPRLNLEDLDEKLDEILEGDIM